MASLCSFQSALLLLLLLGWASAGSFSFKYENGLCRQLTPENEAACCTDEPKNPEGTVFPGKLLVGLGPRKTGTTMLFSLLKQSKKLEVPLFSVKETHFFSTGIPTEVDLQQRNGTLKEYMDFWGDEEYVKNSEKVFVDMSSDYFRDPGLPCRLKRVAPHAKLLIVLRDPAWRAMSLTSMLRTQCYKDSVSHGNLLNERYPDVCCAVSGTLREVFHRAKKDMAARPGCNFHSGKPVKNWKDCGSTANNHNPVEAGMYAAIIAWWFEFYDPKDVLILASDDIQANPAREVNRVLNFLDLPSIEPSMEAVKPFKGKYGWREPQLEATLKEMQGYYTKPLTELYDFLAQHNHSLTPLQMWDDCALLTNEVAKIPLEDVCPSCDNLPPEDCSSKLELFYESAKNPPISTDGVIVQSIAPANVGNVITWLPWSILFVLFMLHMKKIHQKGRTKEKN